MAGTFPTTPEPATINLISVQPSFKTVSESGKRQSRIAGGHLWRIKLSWAKSNRDVFAPLYAFAILQRGGFEDFQFIPSSHKTPLGVATGTPQTVGTQTAGSNTILSDGWTASTTDIMKAGDILKFANHDKVYMMTQDVNSSVGGSAALIIQPPLIQDVPDNTAITVNDVPFTVAMDGDLIEWKASAPHLVSYSLDLIESLQ